MAGARQRAQPKDKMEGALQDLVCADRLTLADAQRAVATEWVSAYRQVLGRDPAETEAT